MNQVQQSEHSDSITIEKGASGWVLTAQQFFDLPVEQIFDYFGDAGNLEAITPPWLHFKVLTPQPIKMHPGTLIDYKLRLHMVPIRWRTEISAWEPPFRFIDQQLRGPYRKWIHEHTFVEQQGGTLMTDRVEYDVLGGSLIHSLLVRRDLLKIFEFRRDVMADHFAKPTA